MFCDLSKAFDRVWHKGFIFKLKQYGISGDLLNWIADHLENRQQMVMIKIYTSHLQNGFFWSSSGLSPWIPIILNIYKWYCGFSLKPNPSLYRRQFVILFRFVYYRYRRHNQPWPTVISSLGKQWLIKFNFLKTKRSYLHKDNLKPFQVNVRKYTTSVCWLVINI